MAAHVLERDAQRDGQVVPAQSAVLDETSVAGHLTLTSDDALPAALGGGRCSGSRRRDGVSGRLLVEVGELAHAASYLLDA